MALLPTEAVLQKLGLAGSPAARLGRPRKIPLPPGAVAAFNAPQDSPNYLNRLLDVLGGLGYTARNLMGVGTGTPAGAGRAALNTLVGGATLGFAPSLLNPEDRATFTDTEALKDQPWYVKYPAGIAADIATDPLSFLGLGAKGGASLAELGGKAFARGPVAKALEGALPKLGKNVGVSKSFMAELRAAKPAKFAAAAPKLGREIAGARRVVDPAAVEEVLKKITRQRMARAAAHEVVKTGRITKNIDQGGIRAAQWLQKLGVSDKPLALAGRDPLRYIPAVAGARALASAMNKAKQPVEGIAGTSWLNDLLYGGKQAKDWLQTSFVRQGGVGPSETRILQHAEDVVARQVKELTEPAKIAFSKLSQITKDLTPYMIDTPPALLAQVPKLYPNSPLVKLLAKATTAEKQVAIDAAKIFVDANKKMNAARKAAGFDVTELEDYVPHPWTEQSKTKLFTAPTLPDGTPNPHFRARSAAGFQDPSKLRTLSMLDGEKLGLVLHHTSIDRLFDTLTAGFQDQMQARLTQKLAGQAGTAAPGAVAAHVHGVEAVRRAAGKKEQFPGWERLGRKDRPVPQILAEQEEAIAAIAAAKKAKATMKSVKNAAPEIRMAAQKEYKKLLGAKVTAYNKATSGYGAPLTPGTFTSEPFGRQMAAMFAPPAKRNAALSALHKASKGLYNPLLTIANPAFHVRNVGGGMVQAAAGEGWAGLNPLGKAKQIAVSIMRGKPTGGFVNEVGERLTATNLAKEITAQHVTGIDLMTREASLPFQKGLLSKIPGVAKYMRAGQQVGQSSEKFMRTAAYIQARMAGLAPMEAAAKSRRFFVDYRMASNADRTLRDIIPFIQYKKGMISPMVESLVLNPSLAAVGGAAIRPGSKEQNVPDYMKEDIRFRTGVDEKGNPKYFVPTQTPFSTLTSLGVGGGRIPILSEIGRTIERETIGSSSPPIKAFIEALTGRNAYFGTSEPYTRPPGVLKAAGVESLDPALRRVYDTLPTVRLQQAFLDLPFDDRKNVGEKILSFLTSARFVSVDEKKGEAKRLQEFLARAAEAGQLRVSKNYASGEGVPEALRLAGAKLREGQKRGPVAVKK